jgi:hypothetical protein
LLAGAEKDMEALVGERAVAVPMVGAPGADVEAGVVIEFDALEAAELPSLFRATTVNV